MEIKIYADPLVKCDVYSISGKGVSSCQQIAKYVYEIERYIYVDGESSLDQKRVIHGCARCTMRNLLGIQRAINENHELRNPKTGELYMSYAYRTFLVKGSLALIKYEPTRADYENHIRHCNECKRFLYWEYDVDRVIIRREVVQDLPFVEILEILNAAHRI